VRSRSFVLFMSRSELFLGLAERPGQFRQFLSAEQQEDNCRDNEEVGTY